MTVPLIARKTFRVRRLVPLPVLSAAVALACVTCFALIDIWHSGEQPNDGYAAFLASLTFVVVAVGLCALLDRSLRGAR